jgi:serine/threonine protein kinase/tetratricopeptide (TPR) repeat protein
MIDKNPSAADPFGVIADEFMEALRQGQRPSVEEFARRYPEHADEIRDLFPALALMERAKSSDDASSVKGGKARASTGRAAGLRQLGDYQILREVGRGGMGVVYEAQQLSLGRHVAIKVLPAHALLDPRQLGRFQREARSAAKLHHTNIVPVFGVGEQDGVHYYVMQFIKGLGLDTVLDELCRLRPAGKQAPTQGDASGGPTNVTRDASAAHVARALLSGVFRQPDSADDLTSVPGKSAARKDEGGRQDAQDLSFVVSPSSVSSGIIHLPGQAEGSTLSESGNQYWQSVARVGVQVANALAHAASQGILHRDIKPSNLLLDDTGNVWVTDFGLAKAVSDSDNLTHTGDIIGTMRYMAPERFDGQGDLRSDVYSLGLTLYELLALRPAFDESDRNKLVKQVMNDEPVRPRKLNPSVPRDLETVILKAIARDPTQRYATAEDLATDLQRFMDDEPILARRQTQIERYWRWARHNPGIAVLGGVLTAVLVAATVVSLLAAGHFNRLRWNEARAAQSERDARDQEAKEREQAEQAKKAADESRGQAEKALQKAEENFARARSAVNEYLTAISDDPRLKESGLSPLRAQLLQSALGFYQEFLKERANDPALRQELAGIYYKVGQIYSDLGIPGPANQSYAQSRRLYEALAADAPDSPVFQDGLARALFKLGQNDQAIALWEKLVRPDDPRYHADLGWAYNTAAIMAARDRAKELEFLRKALATRELLVKLRPDDPEARRGLAASLNNIAVALGSSSPWAYWIEAERETERLSLYRRAVEQVEVAYRLQPSDPLNVRGVVVMVGNVAVTSKLLGRDDEAVAAYRRVIEVLERRVRDNPDVAGTRSGANGQTVAAETVTAYQTLVAYLRELGRLGDAARVARQGREWAAGVTTDANVFFQALARFHLEARAVAEARARNTADASLDVESASTAAVTALRNDVLTGWRDLKWLKTDLLPAPLRKRPDYQDLIARVEALTKAEQVARNAQAAPADKVTARQECLAALEALAGPLPSARLARRSLAQAQQDLAQALLDAGRVEDARQAFARALAVRQKLAEEAPSSEQLRADLAQSQSATGDLFAAAGKLADAVRTWEQALATLEAGLKQNPNSLPFQTALSEQLLHIAYESGRVGLWDLATKYYRRAFKFQIQLPTEFGWWYQFGALLAAANDSKELQSLAARAVVPLGIEKDEWNFFHLSRIFLLSPELASRHPAAFQQIIARVKIAERDWTSWCQGLAHVRLGQAAKGVPLLEKVKEPMQRLPALALALQQLGRTDAARDTLRQADEVADQLLRGTLQADSFKLPGSFWDEWLLCHILRREAHQTIYGKPLPESPYDRLFHGRRLCVLEGPEKAEADLDASVAVRPSDADVWLTRARVFVKLDMSDRAAADLTRAKELQAADPKAFAKEAEQVAKILAQEAKSAIPAAAPNDSPVQEENARRDRKARADRLSTELALAQLRVNVGPMAEAEAELRAVLAGRVKLAEEEPSNPDYRSAVVVSRIQLGGFLADSGQVGKANKELADTVASAQRFVAENPSDRQARYDLAAAHRAVGDVASKTNRPAEAVRALRLGMELLDAARKEDPKNAGLKKLLADVEYQLGEYHAKLGLWSEAAALMRVDDWPETMNVWLRVRAGQLRLLAGDPSSLRKVADRALVSHGTDSGSPDGPHSKAWTLAALTLAHVLTPMPTDDADQLLEWARKAADSAGAIGMPVAAAGAWEVRTGRYADAIRRLDKPALQGQVWAHAIIAMAEHKLNRPDRARERLSRSAGLLADHFRAQFTASESKNNGGWAYLVDDSCLYRQAHELITGKPPSPDPMQRLYRGVGYHLFGETQKAQAEFKAAIDARPDDATVWLARSQAFTRLGRANEAAADRARALQLAEEALTKRPGDSAAANTLAGLLLEKAEPKWTALKPRSAKSAGNATLIVQPDNSMLAGGVNPDRDVYVIEAEVSGRIGAIRLEAIPDPRMQAGGSGRADSGNFILSDFRVTAGESVVAWSRAYADFSQERDNVGVRKFPIAFAIDADESTGWAVWPRVAEPHWAVFIPSRPITASGKTTLTIRLAFRNKDFPKHALSRFRLSVTSDPAVDWFAAASTPHAKVGAAYIALGEFQKAVDLLTKVTAASAKPVPADWLILTLAHARLAESDQARNAAAKAAELLQPTGAEASLRPLLRQVLLALGPGSPEGKTLIAAAAGKPPAALNQAIQQNPDEARGYRDRGEWFIDRGLWKEATADFAEAFRLEPDSYTGMRLGILLLHTGDIERYRTHCQAMLDRWASTEQDGEADHTLKTILLLSDSREAAEQLAHLAEVAVSGDQSADWFEWKLLARELHDYRAGKYADALAVCREIKSRVSGSKGDSRALASANLAIEAMALHRSGDEAGGKNVLAEAKSNVDLQVPGIDDGVVHDWLVADILCREAEGVITRKKVELPR